MDRSGYGWGSGSSSTSGSSSRKGKKDKHRQPQRGLGVAQLEKIRIQSEMAEYQLPSIQSPFSNLNMSDARVSVPVSLSPSQAYTARTTVPMPFGGATGGAFCSEAQSTSPVVRPLLRAPCNIYPTNVSGNSTVTLPLFEGDREDYMQQYNRRWSTDSRENSDSSETQDVDLELKL
ncbi:hypothetical protein LUZ63_019808 [Rhynchospora breviuscula]|uniref:Uncharacterized protein n=1 Tax=Rhynchospora breviuscula TaxID=2022672 RepID=A0A9Q0C6W3_9POAL|nr:hypothetical protein LUZ63_019808 [Rhynchospora breviuscula]